MSAAYEASCYLLKRVYLHWGLGSKLELSGHDCMGQQWRFATSQVEEFWGIAVPLPKAQMQFKQICRQAVRLFDSTVWS
ncbi:hypothetical protein [Leptolyngbya sp. 7M]|uniref:hypothetical protein n=1 Tax=Leptolyngbya sp. 7M TaxID=2812896 RepID=UPI001B8CA896|nr:hypothetical protein [Leptolyngbya sp. 7M]QYO62298.1 hypothetical protein JVX88_19595 [Leptolyngbya sp. 7M]